jgi:hypothetical protein
LIYLSAFERPGIIAAEHVAGYLGTNGNGGRRKRPPLPWEFLHLFVLTLGGVEDESFSLVPSFVCVLRVDVSSMVFAASSSGGALHGAAPRYSVAFRFPRHYFLGAVPPKCPLTAKVGKLTKKVAGRALLRRCVSL